MNERESKEQVSLPPCPNPDCRASHVVRNGSHRGRQRYCCQSCKTYFGETQGTPMYNLKTPTQEVAHAMVHALKECLAPACVPIFTSDGLRLYYYALTAHFGHWIEDGRCRRWRVARALVYGQVRKAYRRRRIVREAGGSARTCTRFSGGPSLPSTTRSDALPSFRAHRMRWRSSTCPRPTRRSPVRMPWPGAARRRGASSRSGARRSRRSPTPRIASISSLSSRPFSPEKGFEPSAANGKNSRTSGCGGRRHSNGRIPGQVPTGPPTSQDAAARPL